MGDERAGLIACGSRPGKEAFLNNSYHCTAYSTLFYCTTAEPTTPLSLVVETTVVVLRTVCLEVVVSSNVSPETSQHIAFW